MGYVWLDDRSLLLIYDGQILETKGNQEDQNRDNIVFKRDGWPPSRLIEILQEKGKKMKLGTGGLMAVMLKVLK